MPAFGGRAEVGSRCRQLATSCIPLLGYLFKHHQKAVTKKELLIFVTPHVVITPTQIDQVTHNESGKADLSRKAFNSQELDKFFDTLPFKPDPSQGTSKH